MLVTLRSWRSPHSKRVVVELRDAVEVDGVDGDDAAFPQGGERVDHHIAAGGEGDGAVEGDGRTFGIVADPGCAHGARELLVRSAARRDIDLAIPGLEHFDDEVRRCAKAEESDAVAGGNFSDAEAAEADDAGAKERREVDRGGLFGKRDEEVGTGDGVFRIAAIDGVARVGGVVAEILAVPAAERAGAVDAAEPGDAGAMTDADGVDAGAEFFHAADDLVSGRNSIAQRRQLTGGDVEIGAAHATGFDLEENLARSGLGDRQIFKGQRTRGDGGGMVEDSGAHLFS